MIDRKIGETKEEECGRCRETLEQLMLKLLGHSIRNPVTILGGFANRLYKKFDGNLREKLDEKDLLKLQVIKREADCLSGITSIFTEFILNPEFTLKETDVHPLIEGVMGIEYDGRIEFKEDFGLKRLVYIDPTRISFCLLNLIGNAKDAILAQRKSKSSANRGILEVSTGVEDNGKEFFIAVKNTGKKIPDEEREKILRHSFTTKDNGTGFGLTFTDEMVRRHQGRIEIKSNEKETVFKLCLPL